MEKKTHQDHVDAIDASVTEHVIELIWHFYSWVIKKTLQI